MKRYKQHIGLACLAALGLSLSACGGGGSSTTTTTTPTTTTPTAAAGGNIIQLSGVVVDGYMKGATAFVDRNNNGKKDVGEPSGITDPYGQYTIQGLKAGDENFPVVVDIPATAVDSDTKQPVGKHSVMSTVAPKNLNKPVVVSPLTTLVKTTLENTPGADVYTAVQRVKNQLKLTNAAKVDLFADYVAGKKTNPDYAKIHKVAQVVARAVANQVDVVDAAAKNVDPNATLADVVSLITAQVVNQLSSIDATVVATDKANTAAKKTWSPTQADTLAVTATVPVDIYSKNFTTAVQKQIQTTVAAAQKAQAAADAANAKAQAALQAAQAALTQAQQLQDQYAALVAQQTAALAQSAAAKVAADPYATVAKKAAATQAAQQATAIDPYATVAQKTALQAAAQAAAARLAATPVITLLGANPYTVVKGTTWVDPGSVVTDDVYSTLKAKATGTVVASVVGTYYIQYNVTDPTGYKATTVTRTVNVVKDTVAPTINYTGNTVFNLSLGGVVPTPVVTVSDNIDANLKAVLTGSVNTAVVGKYTLTYNATDSSGNKATPLVITVNVADKTPPTIALNGAAKMSIVIGSTFTDPSATVTDNYDKGLTATVTGKVNTAALGIYTLTYSAKDAAGNAAKPVTRTVIVRSQQPPVFTNAPLPKIVIPAVASTTPYTLATPVATSAAGTVTMTSDAPKSFPVGVTTVTWTATDVNGISSTTTQTVDVLGTVAQGDAAMSAGTPTSAKAFYLSASAQKASDIAAALGVCQSTMAAMAGNTALHSLFGKFTTDAGATLPTPVSISQNMMGANTAQPPVNWAKTATQLAQTAANATLLQDPALDTVIAAATTCIQKLESVKSSSFTMQTVVQGTKTTLWDRADLNAMLSMAYGVRGVVNWARAYNWSTDVNADGIPDTQVQIFTNPADGYTYAYQTVNTLPVEVLNDPTFFTLAPGGATLLMSSVADFYSAASDQALYLTAMSGSIARATSFNNAFNYGPNMLKLSNDLKSAQDTAATFSASGLLQSKLTKNNVLSTGTIYGANLTALTRAAFPKFRYDLTPNSQLSKRYNNPVVAEIKQGWGNNTVNANVIADTSYDPTLSGVLATGMTLDLFDDIHRPVKTTLITDMYGNPWNKYSLLATDGYTHVLVTPMWQSATGSVDICTVNNATGQCGNVFSYNTTSIPDVSGVALANGQLRIASPTASATIVINPTTGVSTRIPWSGSLPLAAATTNAWYSGFSSDGTNDYLFVSSWGQTSAFNWGYTTMMYQAPSATGVFGTGVTIPNNSYFIPFSSVTGGNVYSFSNGSLQRFNLTTRVQTSANWNFFGSHLRNPIVVGNKMISLGGSNATLVEYTLPPAAQFR